MMEDKLVVGRRAIGDGLKDMERFAGNESEVVFPEWKQKLFDRRLSVANARLD